MDTRLRVSKQIMILYTDFLHLNIHEGHVSPAHNVLEQSGEDLAAEFVNWKKVSRQEYLKPFITFMETLNMEALRTLASGDMGNNCTKVHPIAAGGFNIVYYLAFLDGREAIARLNREEQTRDQGLLRDRVVSEASTLRYIKRHMSVPVPEVYIVNDRLPNPVGARFIIEERVLGRQLWLYRPGYTATQRKVILTKVFQCEAEFIRARFNVIGSIYHRPEDDTFYVGPMGPAVNRPLNHTVDRGPWTSTREWLKAYVKSELVGIKDDPEDYRTVRIERKLDNGDPPFAYHVAWLETLLTVLDKLQFLRDLSAAVERPVLHHEDLSGGNILVSYADPADLAGLIDFEGARVVPLWSAIDVPVCCDLEDKEEEESLLKLRLEILCQADPACAQAKLYRKPLCALRWLVFMGITSWCSIDMLHQKYKEVKQAWPVEEPAFSALDKLVAFGPAGYITRRNVQTSN